jgi:septal ring factor EnvC (AmiA/AmiB activator)
MATLAAQFPTSFVRPRVLAVTLAALATLLVVFGATTAVLYSQLTDTRATLASTQVDLGSTQEQLASTQADLSSTQDQLTSTQTTLTQTQSDRDAFSSQVDQLNASVSDLTNQRDGVQAQLTQAQADLQTARNNASTASAARDQAQGTALVLQQGATFEGNLIAAVGAYDGTVTQQMDDLNNGLNAAVRYDWVTERFYADRYNARLPLMYQQYAAVTTAVNQLESFLHAHPGL